MCGTHQQAKEMTLKGGYKSYNIIRKTSTREWLKSLAPIAAFVGLVVVVSVGAVVGVNAINRRNKRASE